MQANEQTQASTGKLVAVEHRDETVVVMVEHG